eukprot:5541937-Amphidinium_carterae.1
MEKLWQLLGELGIANAVLVADYDDGELRTLEGLLEDAGHSVPFTALVGLRENAQATRRRAGGITIASLRQTRFVENELLVDLERDAQQAMALAAPLSPKRSRRKSDIPSRLPEMKAARIERTLQAEAQRASSAKRVLHSLVLEAGLPASSLLGGEFDKTFCASIGEKSLQRKAKILARFREW